MDEPPPEPVAIGLTPGRVREREREEHLALAPVRARKQLRQRSVLGWFRAAAEARLSALNGREHARSVGALGSATP
jgi:hypothetical protein